MGGALVSVFVRSIREHVKPFEYGDLARDEVMGQTHNDSGAGFGDRYMGWKVDAGDAARLGQRLKEAFPSDRVTVDGEEVYA